MTVLRPLSLFVWAVMAVACQRPQVTLDLQFVALPDGGTDAGCAAFTDLSCVNFIKFQISSSSSADLATQCVKATQRLETLCDLRKLATGDEIFRHGAGDTVQIKMWGLRVFPATSCEINPECEPKVLFSGTTDARKLGEVSGTLPLRINQVANCGDREEYLPRIGGATCAGVCGDGTVVCAMSEGCVCALPDTALQQDGGTWVGL